MRLWLTGWDSLPPTECSTWNSGCPAPACSGVPSGPVSCTATPARRSRAQLPCRYEPAPPGRYRRRPCPRGRGHQGEGVKPDVLSAAGAPPILKDIGLKRFHERHRDAPHLRRTSLSSRTSHPERSATRRSPGQDPFRGVARIRPARRLQATWLLDGAYLFDQVAHALAGSFAAQRRSGCAPGGMM